MYDIVKIIVIFVVVTNIALLILFFVDISEVNIIDLQLLINLLILLVVSPLILYALKKYKQYRTMSNIEIYPAGPKCKCLSLLLEFLNNIALTNKYFLLRFHLVELEEFKHCIETLQSVNYEAWKDTKSLLKKLRIDLESGSLEAMKNSYFRISKVIVLSSILFIALFLAIMGIQGELTVHKFILVLALLVIALLSIGMLQDHIFARNMEKLLRIDALDDSNVVLLADRIIKRILATISSHISKPIVLFLRSRYKYLAIKKSTLFSLAFVLEPSRGKDRSTEIGNNR